MRSARRKTVLWLAGLSLAAVVAVTIFGRQQIVERWYIYQLGSDDAEKVDDAARKLAAMGSTRAIMPLIEQIPREIERGRRIDWQTLDTLDPTRPFRVASRTRIPESYATDSAVLKALSDLGDPAKEALERRRMNQLVNDVLDDLCEVMKAGQSLHYSKELPAPHMQPISSY